MGLLYTPKAPLFAPGVKVRQALSTWGDVVSTLSLSHDIMEGDDRCVLAAIYRYHWDVMPTITSVDLNGVTLRRLAGEAEPVANIFVDIYALEDFQPVGPGSLRVTLSGSCADVGLALIDLAGVDRLIPIGATVETGDGYSTRIAAGVVSPTLCSIAAACGSSNTATYTADNEELVTKQDDGGNSGFLLMQYSDAPNVNHGWDVSVSVSWAAAAVGIEPARRPEGLRYFSLPSNPIKVLNETESIQEAVVFHRDRVSVLGSVIQIAETVTLFRARASILDETVEIAGGLAKRLGGTKIYNETQQLVAGIVKTTGLGRIFDETVNLLGSFARAAGRTRSMAETIEVDEGDSSFFVAAKVLGEAIQIAEQIVLSFGLVRAYSETEQVVEARVRILSVVKVYVEILNILESIRKVLPGGLVEVYTEAVNLAAAAVIHRGRVWPLGESVQIAGAFSFSRVLSRPMSESVQISEGFIKRLSGLLRVLGETIEVAEGLVSARSVIKVLSETVSIFDGIARRFPSVLFIAGITSKWTVPSGGKTWTIPRDE